MGIIKAFFIETFYEFLRHDERHLDLEKECPLTYRLSIPADLMGVIAINDQSAANFIKYFSW
ncbi:Uncharacterised protein [Legionella oakridgensis]|nr:Uncharacterised protein [Legionella oakridgensis]